MSRYIDGRAKTRMYIIYCHMKCRCYCKTADSYKWYGGRGIKICDRWLNGEGDKDGYQCFDEDMGASPTEKHTVDRIDNDGDYTPDNCRWATQAQQNRNYSRNVHFTIFGRRMVFEDACELYGIKRQTVESRIKTGWSIDDAFTKPVQKRRKQNGRQ